MYGFFWHPAMLVVIPGLLLALYAQYKVMSAYRKYSQVGASTGMTAAQAARRLLDRSGLYNVKIEAVPGHLSDHYDPRTKTLRISAAESTSLAAIGVAAHEAGHALQDAEKYPMLALRSAVVPIAQFAPPIGIILFFVGLLFIHSQPLWTAGLILFSAALAFSLITLPVEFDASSRAIRVLRDSGIVVAQKELDSIQTVLSAAALTYVAAAIMSALELLQYFLMARSASNDR
ncbi:zinc metallopeptidase [Candidatus Acetothermia bacterium]|nr:zinc metallopeptidase [Candidatus Acetothermia bacterium]